MQKNGERAGSPFSGGVRDGPRPVAAAGLHADQGGTIGVDVSIEENAKGYAGAHAHGGAVGAVSALRLPQNRDLPRP